MIEDTLHFLGSRLSGEVLDIVDPSQHDMDDIISSYFLLIVWLARRYERSTVELEDLVHEGIIGLLDAVKRFEPGRSESPNAFHNLAIVRIKNYMFEHLLHNSSKYHIPTYMARAMSLVEQALTILSSCDYDGDPETDLIDFEAPYAGDRFPQNADGKLRGVKHTLQKLAKNSGKTYEDIVRSVLQVKYNIGAYEEGSPEGGRNSTERMTADREFVEKVLEMLPSKSRDTIRLRLAGRTLEEVGKAVGFTRERARQVENDTLTFLHKTRMFREATEDMDRREER